MVSVMRRASLRLLRSCSQVRAAALSSVSCSPVSFVAKDQIEPGKPSLLRRMAHVDRLVGGAGDAEPLPGGRTREPGAKPRIQVAALNPHATLRDADTRDQPPRIILSNHLASSLRRRFQNCSDVVGRKKFAEVACDDDTTLHNAV